MWKTFALWSDCFRAVWSPLWAWPTRGSCAFTISKRAPKYATTATRTRCSQCASIAMLVRHTQILIVLIFEQNEMKKKQNIFKRLVVCLEERIDIHNISDMRVIHTIRDIPSNPKGLCALSVDNEKSYLAYPGSSQVGEVQIFDTINLVNLKSIILF